MLSRGRKYIKNIKILEVKVNISEMKNTLDRINDRLMLKD